MPYGTYDPIELIDRMERRIGGDTVTALVSMLGRLGTIDLLVQALGLDEADAQGVLAHKVLVMGASMVSVDKLRSITHKAGFNQDWFEYRLDYAKLDRRSIGHLRNSSYSAVIVRPMHHSMERKGDASSAIQRMKDHPESYPPVIEARDSNGLKITNNSFKEALKELDELFAA
ncbi:MAG: hypothetical protein Q4A07_05645 [Coriobacteriales bacterium]|nr:hypothetical protein [Coriobacteriales bacterium]